jgi:hypothetical protein
VKIYIPPGHCSHLSFPACVGDRCWCCWKPHTPCFSTKDECTNACRPN